MKGKLIVIEGTDGAGKETQSKLLYNSLKEEGYNCHLVHFPNYESPSSSLVKMYLNGEFGDNPSDINPYAIATFYACDRYASWMKTWKKWYEQGDIIIADRYVISNLIHQGSKLDSKSDRDKFKQWLEELEYNTFGIPKPDLIFFFVAEVENTFKLMDTRKNKISGEESKDIHEKDRDYMSRSYSTALELCNENGWQKIYCTENNQMRDKEIIHSEINKYIKEFFGW